MKASEIRSLTAAEIEAKIVEFREDEHKISLSVKALTDGDEDVASVDLDAIAAEEE